MSIISVAESVLVALDLLGEDEVTDACTILKKEDRLVISNNSWSTGKEYLIEIKVAEIE